MLVVLADRHQGDTRCQTRSSKSEYGLADCNMADSVRSGYNVPSRTTAFILGKFHWKYSWMINQKLAVPTQTILLNTMPLQSLQIGQYRSGGIDGIPRHVYVRGARVHLLMTTAARLRSTGEASFGICHFLK